MREYLGESASFLKAVPGALLADDLAIVSIANRARENYGKIANFDIDDVIKRHMKDNHVDIQAAREQAVELKKFLAICSVTGVGMAGPVDELWHTFVIFTRKYAEICERIGSFIHHEPDTTIDDHENSVSGYARFLDIYELTYQETPPAHIWPSRALLAEGEAGASSCGGCGNACSPAGCSSCAGCQGQSPPT
jgi:hypothetical protein